MHLGVFHHVVLLFSFVSTYFLTFLTNSPLIHWLLKTVVFNLHIFTYIYLIYIYLWVWMILRLPDKNVRK